MPKTQPKTFEFKIDGQPVDLDDLTFREMHEYRSSVRELAGDPELDLAFATGMDKWPVLVWLIRRRENADYTLDEALDTVKTADVLVETEPRPTRAAPTA